MTNTSVKLAIVCVAAGPGCTVVAPASTAAALENTPTGSAKLLEGETMGENRPTTSKPTQAPQSDRAKPSPALTPSIIACVLQHGKTRHYGWTRGFGEHHCIKWRGPDWYQETSPRSWRPADMGKDDPFTWFETPHDIMTAKERKTAQEAAHEKDSDVLAA